jgi:hypothetical protein
MIASVLIVGATVITCFLISGDAQATLEATR